MLQARFPFIPAGATEVSRDLAVLLDDERLTVFNGSGPIFTCSRTDRDGVRLAAAMFSGLDLASPTALAHALDLHPATVFRSRQRLESHGIDGVRTRKPGPKGPSKLTDAVLVQVRRRLAEGWSLRRAAEEVGVVEGTLRHAMRRGLLTHVVAATRGERSTHESKLQSPSARAARDQAAPAGVAVKRAEDRALARAGRLTEATPEFHEAEAVPGAGVLVALPALMHEGLIDVGTEVYGALSDGFFGLRSVLLTFAFMALLRIKTPEQLTEHAPGELGLLLGLDRAPEVKTLRRKLREMGARQLARTFTRRLTERWARAEPKELALLYVDGHVRPYHGRTHVLPKHHVQQRGRAMPGTKDFHVNDRRADPLFFVTAEANDGLLEMLDTTLLPEARRLVDGGRRITVVFDREGWSPVLFAKWREQSFDVLTYRKGEQSRWREKSFAKVRGTVGGEEVEYVLAERSVTLSNGLRVREIRRLADDGHQTAVITTSNSLPMLSVAHRMFSRWRQENFFRYMRHEFALDHLCTHEVEPADPERVVKSPLRAALEKKLKAARSARTRLVEQRLNVVPGKTARVGKRWLDENELDALLARTEAEIERLGVRVAALPKQVPLDTVLPASDIVQLERERKVIVDAVKLTAYRAESALARVVEPLFARHEDEARKFLKSIFAATADLIPDRSARTLTVRFHGLSSPRATRALAELCALVNEDAPIYPGTHLKLHFEAPESQE